jgi:putative membrane protein
MVNANSAISEEDALAISAKIAEIEAVSQAEVVCALATESGRYDRAEGIVGIATALLALLIGNCLLGEPSAGDGEWVEYASLSLGLQLFLTAGGFLLGNVIASYFPPLRRLCTRKDEMDREVDRAAAQVFAGQHLRRTRDASGLQIYVSLYERQIRLLADDGIPLDLELLIDLALPELRLGAIRSAYEAVLTDLSDPLAETFPANDEKNELSDQFLRFHPRPF